MSKTGLGVLALIIMVALIPFAFVARSRASRSNTPAQNPVPDMDDQPKKKAQSSSPMFADERSMRPQVEGTVAREDMELDPEILNDPKNPRLVDSSGKPIDLTNPTMLAELTLGRSRPAGMTDEQFDAAKPVTLTNPKATDDDIAADTFYVKTIPSPIHVTADFVHRGQERFNIYCSPCHGQSGYGDGAVNQHAQAMKAAGIAGRDAAGWNPPQDLNAAKIHTRPDGYLFNVITNGIRTMPGYEKQISILDRWAIISYVRALQTSQDAPPPAAAK